MRASSLGAEELQALQDDLAYHQMRVLLLIDAVSQIKGNAGKLDGLTKLAKLDFLVRYPSLAQRVLDKFTPEGTKFALANRAEQVWSGVEAPMIRYKYGPWDNRYYPIIGALVGRGLARYTVGRRGSVALATTPTGRRLSQGLKNSNEWRLIAQQCEAVAQAAAGLTGNALKDLVYARLPELMDRPHREVI